MLDKTSNLEPCFSAFNMPSGIQIRYDNNHPLKPKIIDICNLSEIS